MLEFLRIFFYILLILSIIPLGLLLYMLIRVNRVTKYRMALLAEITKASSSDISANRDYTWRYKVFDSIEFNDMCNRFWKPLPSFYSDMSFVDPNATELPEKNA